MYTKLELDPVKTGRAVAIQTCQHSSGTSVRSVTLLFTLPSLPSFFGFYFTLLLPSFEKTVLLYFTFTEFRQFLPKDKTR